jgi:hypothetical protein
MVFVMATTPSIARFALGFRHLIWISTKYLRFSCYKKGSLVKLGKCIDIVKKSYDPRSGGLPLLFQISGKTNNLHVLFLSGCP